MKKLIKIAAGIYLYWCVDACAWSILKKKGYKIPGTGKLSKFINWSINVVDERLENYAEFFCWEHTEEEDEFDPDDYDWESIFE